VSTNGGGDPLWAHDGGELFFRSPEGDLMSVDVSEDDAGLRVSTPRIVTSRPRSFARGYAVFPDDQRFLFMESDGEESRYILVLNFLEELKSRVPN
jgi:hypothetical protein